MPCSMVKADCLDRASAAAPNMPGPRRRLRFRRPTRPIGPGPCKILLEVLANYPGQSFVGPAFEFVPEQAPVSAPVPERLEAACQRGMDIGARTYGSVNSILRNGLDRAYRPEPVTDELPVQHENIRGSGYYH